MDTILEVRDLCKTYVVNKRQNNVLKNINVTIHSGEMVAVMGPSGSGKSTLLYTVSGMDEPSAGQIIFDGRDIAGLDRKTLAQIRLDDMGFIFQQMYMLKNLSILDNILLPAFQSKKPGMNRKEKIKRGQQLMRRLGIMETAENDINEVSGGQLQRACICRSMINNPKMLFADEPTGALNRASSDEVIGELAGLNRDGTTIMLVTHDVKVAASCSRVLYLVDGCIAGQYNLEQEKPEADRRERERAISSWLLDMGWSGESRVDILIVEDNDELAEVLLDFLVAEGYEAEIAGNGYEALELFSAHSPRLVILDIMLPGMDGFTVCTEIRRLSDVPVIIVSARGEKTDMLDGLGLGADDYIEKPYDIDILLAKISGIFERRYRGRMIKEGSLTIDCAKREVYLDGRHLPLTVKEYELLLLLVKNKEIVISKEELFNKVWGVESESELQTLTVHIKRLRQKIEKDPGNPRCILTVWGVGYKFVQGNI